MCEMDTSVKKDSTCLLIINPKAGKLKLRHELMNICDELCRGNLEVTCYVTSCRGDALQKAAACADRFDIIVACGGDGTLNEVISGVLSVNGKCKVAYIPLGTTNDVAKSIGIPTESAVASAKCIVDGAPKLYDVGLFGGNRYFNYVASFGAFTKASYATSQKFKNVFGHAAYVLSGIKSVADIHPVHVIAEFDFGTVEGDYIFGAVTNSTSVGGVMKLDPEKVDFGDGLFELLLIKAPKNAAQLANIVNAVMKKSFDCEQIVFGATKRCKLISQNPLDFTLDGEYGGKHTEVEIINLHGAIRLQLPK